MVLRSALAFTSSVVVHALVFGVMWLQPAPPPPPPPPDGSPVSLAAFDFDDAPTESSSPTPSEVATPPDEAPPAPVAVTAPVTPLPDPMGIDSQPPQPEAAMETGEGEKAAEEKKKGPTLTHGAKARRPTRTPKPCPESVANIQQLGPSEWFVERSLLEYYAGHISEIDTLGSVWTHKGPDGKPDGFRLGLPRCTVLRDGGLRSGDVVHDINGVRINNVLQAVAAYIQLRKEPVLVLHVTRKKQSVNLTYHLEQKDRQKKSRKGKP